MEVYLQRIIWIVCGRFILAAALAAFMLIGMPVLLSAAQTTIIINEIMWMGSVGNSSDEWIELKNTTADPIDLAGWTIAGAATGSSAITIVSGTIAVDGYFLVANYDSFNSAISDNITVDSMIPGISLANGGEQLILKNAAGDPIDTSPTGIWQDGNNNDEPADQRNSMERNDTPGEGANWENWHTCLATNCHTTTFWDTEDVNYGTPKQANSEPVVPASPSPSVAVSPAPTPPPSPAASPDPNQEYSDAIIINEFLPNPVGADAEGEFIELKNTGAEEVNLENWQLDDSAGGSSAYVIPAGTSIKGGGIIVFRRPATRLALNNGGDDVRLFSPDKEIRDEHSYDNSVSEGVARARDEEGIWQWSTTPTPGEDNIITWEQEEEINEDEQEYSDAIVINEFLPNPAGSDTTAEFIELKNTGEEEINLAGWELDDGDGGSGRYDISAGESLAAGELKVFWRSDTKIALNNSGDEVRLFSPNGEEKASFIYEDSVGEDISYNRTDDGDYVLSTTPTPGEQNIITEPEAADGGDGKVAGATVIKMLLKDVRNKAVGTMVEVEGVVSAPPGVFGDKIMYLAGSGIQIYFYREEYPELEVGDKVRVRGELAMSLGEYRIKLTAVKDVTAIGESLAPEPHQVKTGEIGEKLEGTLVIIAGKVTRTSGDTFYIDDGSGEVKVFIKRTTDIDKPPMKKGMAITITGIVSETKSGYRVLPRWQTDISSGLLAGMNSFPTAGESALSQRYNWLTNQKNLLLGLILSIPGYLLFSARKNKEPLIAKS